jgi:hypothetical protein
MIIGAPIVQHILYWRLPTVNYLQVDGRIVREAYYLPI